MTLSWKHTAEIALHQTWDYCVSVQILTVDYGYVYTNRPCSLGSLHHNSLTHCLHGVFDSVKITRWHYFYHCQVSSSFFFKLY